MTKCSRCECSCHAEFPARICPRSWDTRQKTPTSSLQAHDQEILAVAFNPGAETLLITGSADKVRGGELAFERATKQSEQTILLHDIKRLGKPLHTFEAHTDEVLHLAWSPHSATIFASASSDRRINVWDLAQIGVEQTPDDQEDGPPELMFIHGGTQPSPAFFSLTYGSRRSYGTSLRLLLGTRGGRTLDGGEHVGRQRGDGVAADDARLGWRGGAC